MRTIAAGASVSFHQYVSTNPSAVGVGPTVPAAQIPMPSEWALIGLAGLLAVLGLRRARDLRA